MAHPLAHNVDDLRFNCTLAYRMQPPFNKDHDSSFGPPSRQLRNSFLLCSVLPYQNLSIHVFQPPVTGLVFGMGDFDIQASIKSIFYPQPSSPPGTSTPSLAAAMPRITTTEAYAQDWDTDLMGTYDWSEQVMYELDASSRETSTEGFWTMRKFIFGSFALLSAATLHLRLRDFRRKIYERHHPRPTIVWLGLHPLVLSQQQRANDNGEIHTNQAPSASPDHQQLGNATGTSQQNQAAPSAERFELPNWYQIIPVQSHSERIEDIRAGLMKPSKWEAAYALLWWLAQIPNLGLWILRFGWEFRKIGYIRAMGAEIKSLLGRSLSWILSVIQDVALNIHMIYILSSQDVRAKIRDLEAFVRQKLGDTTWEVITGLCRMMTYRASWGYLLLALACLWYYINIWSDPEVQAMKARHVPIIMEDRTIDPELRCGFKYWIYGWPQRTKTICDGFGATTLADCNGITTIAAKSPYPTITKIEESIITVTDTVRQYCPHHAYHSTTTYGSPFSQTFVYDLVDASPVDWRMGKQVKVANSTKDAYCSLCKQRHCCEHALH